MEAILPLALLVAAFYLLVMRPMKLRSRRAADLKANLKPGVEVITTAGVFGSVERIEGDEVFLEIAPGVVVRMMSAAVGNILNPDEQTTGAPAESATDGGPATGDDQTPPKTL